MNKNKIDGFSIFLLIAKLVLFEMIVIALFFDISCFKISLQDMEINALIQDHAIYNAYMKIHPEFKGKLNYNEFVILRDDLLLTKK
jgi:hypothetical protein